MSGRTVMRLLRASGIAALAALLCASMDLGVAAAVADWPVEAPPPPLEARPVGFPPYQLHTLANGMQVIVVMHHEQPEVSMRLLVRAGAAFDPPGKSGVATLTAELLDQGTTTRSAETLAETVDSIGGMMETGAGVDLTSASVLVMKDSFGLGMEMLADIVRRPVFAPEELERQRSQALAALQVSLEDPDFIASAVFARLVYGSHPYGFPETGVPESLARITRDDVRTFHDRYFAPNNSILAIVGDVEDGAALAAAERVFGDWPRRSIDAPAFPAPPRPARRIVVVDKPDAVQTAVRDRPAWRAPQDPRLHGARRGAPHSGRRGEQPALSGAAGRAEPHVLGLGGHEHDAAGR